MAFGLNADGRHGNRTYPAVPLLAAALLLFMICLFFSELMTFEKTFFFRDFHHYFFPLKHYLAETVNSGTVPWWNPYEMCGTPFMANLQAGIFYPPNVLFYILPFQYALNLFVILHFFMASFFMFILLRRWNYSCGSAFLGSVLFTFGGVQVSLVNVLNNLHVSVWAPLVFLCWDLYAERGKTKYLVLTSLFITVQFLGGAPVVLFITVVLLFGRILLRRKSSCRKYIRGYSLMGVLALLFSSFQLLPSLQMAKYSTRSIIVSGLSWSLSPRSLLNVFLPRIYFPGKGISAPAFPLFQENLPWILSIYAGVFVIVLAVHALIFSKKRKEMLFWTISAVIFVFLSFGKYLAPVAAFLNLTVFFNLFMIPEKFLWGAFLALTFMAAEGMEVLTEDRRKTWLPCVLISSAAAAIWIFKSVVVHKPALLFRGVDVELKSWLYSGKLDYIILLLLVYLLLLLINTAGKKGFKNLLTAGMVIILYLELTAVNGPVNPTVHYDFYESKPPLAEFVEDEPEPVRVHSCAEDPGHSGGVTEPYRVHTAVHGAMIPNIGTVFGVPNSFGNEPVFLTGPFMAAYSICRTPDSKEKRSLMAAMNAGYLVTPEIIDSPDFLPLYRSGKYRVYRMDEYLPRVYTVAHAEKAAPGRMLDMLAKGAGHLSKHVYIQSPPDGNYEKPAADPPGRVEILETGINEVKLEVHMEHPGYVVLLNTYYPGWQAEVNENPRSPLQANGNFMALPLDTGDYAIRFYYREKLFPAGSALTLAGIILAVLLMAHSRFRITKETNEDI